VLTTDGRGLRPRLRSGKCASAALPSRSVALLLQQHILLELPLSRSRSCSRAGLFLRPWKRAEAVHSRQDHLRGAASSPTPPRLAMARVHRAGGLAQGARGRDGGRHAAIFLLVRPPSPGALEVSSMALATERNVMDRFEQGLGLLFDARAAWMPYQAV
jgi:hypothetical protein